MQELPPPAPSRRDSLVAVALFFATLGCVFLVYGHQWAGGDPLTDAAIAWDSARFAVGLMSILLAHEMGHYVVARRHGFALSLPYFLPFPAAFGTFGAIIRLKSLPPNRSALLEMGAAGPLAGFAVAMLVLALGLPHTTAHALPLVPLLPLDPTALAPGPPGALEQALAWLFSHPPLSWLLDDLPSGGVSLMVMANPPVMDLMGALLLGAPPGRYDVLDPLATAGWVGCLLTGINLLPIGQLDGGHILNAAAPRLAPRIARIGVGLALLGGLAWSGWAVWGVLLLAMGAWVSLPVPRRPPLSPRARLIGLLAVMAFALSFMPRPLVVENLSLDQVQLVDEDGRPLPPPPAPAPALVLPGAAEPEAGPP